MTLLSRLPGSLLPIVALIACCGAAHGDGSAWGVDTFAFASRSDGAAVLGTRDEYVAQGRAALHDALAPYLTDDKARTPHAETARQLGLGEGAVRMAVLRMRRRFGELLRAEIAQTVAKPEEIDEEIRALLAAVAL